MRTDNPRTFCLTHCIPLGCFSRVLTEKSKIQIKRYTRGQEPPFLEQIETPYQIKKRLYKEKVRQAQIKLLTYAKTINDKISPHIIYVGFPDGTEEIFTNIYAFCKNNSTIKENRLRDVLNGRIEQYKEYIITKILINQDKIEVSKNRLSIAKKTNDAEIIQYINDNINVDDFDLLGNEQFIYYCKLETGEIYITLGARRMSYLTKIRVNRVIQVATGGKSHYKGAILRRYPIDIPDFQHKINEVKKLALKNKEIKYNLSNGYIPKQKENDVDYLINRRKIEVNKKRFYVVKTTTDEIIVTYKNVMGFCKTTKMCSTSKFYNLVNRGTGYNSIVSIKKFSGDYSLR